MGDYCDRCFGSGWADGGCINLCESCDGTGRGRDVDGLKAEIEALSHWRGLALQFDNHRMAALWHLKRLVVDPQSQSCAEMFLKEPPMSAHEVVAELDQLKTELECARGDIRTAQGIIAGKQDEIEHLKAELNHLKGSSSLEKEFSDKNLLALLLKCDRLQKDADRWLHVKSLATKEERDGGYTGFWRLPNLPGWDGTPYSRIRNEGYNYSSVDDAIESVMQKVKK